MANKEEKRHEGRSMVSLETRCPFYGITVYIMLDTPCHISSVCKQKHVFANCPAYGLGPRNWLIFSPLARSVKDSAGQILPKLLLCSLLTLSVICLTLALLCTGIQVAQKLICTKRY